MQTDIIADHRFIPCISASAPIMFLLLMTILIILLLFFCIQKYNVCTKPNGATNDR